MSARVSPVARLRGLTASAFTCALAVAAHALAGGGWPTGGAAALLVVVAVAICLAAVADRAAQKPTLIALLAAGQGAAHAALACGHLHGETSTVPWQLMLLAHALAVIAGASLMSAAEGLCCALSRVVRRCVTTVCGAPHVPKTTRAWLEHPPRQHVLLLAASISHRGPPVCAKP
ncbi:hypothetical protein [Mycolicibacterium mengxianglii]|uniref:hypothetical protein n=1 Tax=Mycolicibacterium mengxianglii TaxID=2736649 RepID=UPI0018D14A30|nr:hypothetical protein [Mycolicibacterium mengxianglii]